MLYRLSIPLLAVFILFGSVLSFADSSVIELTAKISSNHVSILNFGNIKAAVKNNSNVLVLRNARLGVISLSIHSLLPHTRSTRIEGASNTYEKDDTLYLGEGTVKISRGLSTSNSEARKVRASISAKIFPISSKESSFLKIRFTKLRGAGRVFEVKAPLNSSGLLSSPAARVRQVTLRALSQKTCGQAEPLSDTSLTSAALNVGPSLTTQSILTPQIAAASTTKNFTVSTDCDLECSNKLGQSSANDTILEFYNSVNVVYARDLDYHFSVVGQLTRTTSTPYPASATVADTLLGLLQTQASSLRAADFKHLITGKTMQENVVGLSYVGVACLQPSFTLGYSQHLNSLLTPIVIAHEMGHNLNASHDPSQQGIMAARLSSPFPTAFSDYSKSQIQSFVSSMGRFACYDLTSDSSPSSVSSSTSSTSSISSVSSSSSSSAASNGGGGGSTVGDSYEAIFSAKVSKANFVASISQPSGSNCTVNFQVARSEGGLSSETSVIFSSSISNLDKITLKALSLPKVKVTKSGQKALVWFNVRSNCSEGIASTNSKSINVAIAASKAKGHKTVKNTKSWISQFKNSLTRE